MTLKWQYSRGGMRTNRGSSLWMARYTSQQPVVQKQSVSATTPPSRVTQANGICWNSYDEISDGKAWPHTLENTYAPATYANAPRPSPGNRRENSPPTRFQHARGKSSQLTSSPSSLTARVMTRYWSW